MKEHPILFSAPMVRAILDGRKTMTRRVVKWQGPKGYPHSFDHARIDSPAGVQRLLVPFNHPSEADAPWWENGAHRHYPPYGDPGDRLWVRENGWQRPERTPKMMREGADTWARYYYDADGLTEQDAYDFKRWGFKRRPSIHMPRWASRITLEITGVRVERLNDISYENAQSEGCGVREIDRLEAVGYNETWEQTSRRLRWPQRLFENLWNEINGAGSWAANPWVWVVEFKRIAQ